MNKCLKCGSEAELLLNLQSCSSPRCNNFDLKYHHRWFLDQEKQYAGLATLDWIFLGGFVSRLDNVIYDLYVWGSEVFAVFDHTNLSTSLAHPIYVGEKDTGNAIGIYMDFWNIEHVSNPGKEAILEASARAKLRESTI